MSDISKKIESADDIKGRIVNVPEWGVEIEFREMNGEDRAWFLEKAYNPDTETMILSQHGAEAIIASAFIPGTNDKVFEMGELDMLRKKNGKVIDRLALVALTESALTAVAEAELKNGSGAESEDSTSPYQKNSG